MHTKVDFYILKNANRQARWQTACRLLAKAFKAKHHIDVFTQNENDAEQLDKLLWTFQDTSFIPHRLHTSNTSTPVPIKIAPIGSEPRSLSEQTDIVMNLSSHVPSLFKEYHRILEIVPDEPTLKAQLREHYRTYQDWGLSIQTHEL